MVSLVKWCPVIITTEEKEPCGMCHINLEKKCISCTNSKPYIHTKKCEIVYNKNCGHGFHDHCINTWSKNNSTCPYDMKPWNASKHRIVKTTS